MMSLLPMWYGDDGTLTARNTVSSAAAEGNQPVEPGGPSIGRTLQQIRLRVEDLEGIGTRTLEWGQKQGDAIAQTMEAKVGGANLPLDRGGTGTINNGRN